MNKKEFPCCDLLTEARLDGQELIHELSKITSFLAEAVRAGDYDEEEEECRSYAKQAKEEIHLMTGKLLKIRDKITFW